MRTILCVLYVFLFLVLGLPVLGVEWLIAKRHKQAADISQLRIVQWGFRCVAFLAGIKLTVKGTQNHPDRNRPGEIRYLDLHLPGGNPQQG